MEIIPSTPEHEKPRGEKFEKCERDTVIWPDVTIYSASYGCAGAVDLFDDQYGVPDTFCTALNYYYFSRDNMREGTWIVIDANEFYLARKFGEVRLAKTNVSDYRQPHRIGIYVCRYPKFDIEKAKKDITELY